MKAKFRYSIKVDDSLLRLSWSDCIWI